MNPIQMLLCIKCVRKTKSILSISNDSKVFFNLLIKYHLNSINKSSHSLFCDYLFNYNLRLCKTYLSIPIDVLIQNWYCWLFIKSKNMSIRIPFQKVIHFSDILEIDFSGACKTASSFAIRCFIWSISVSLVWSEETCVFN